MLDAIDTDLDTVADPLLRAYDPHRHSWFSSPRGSLLAEGKYFVVPPSARPQGLADLPGRVAASLRVAEAAGHDTRVAIGAVPFRPDAPAHVFIPQRLDRSGPYRPGGATTAWPADPVTARVEHVPEPDRYVRAVGDALRRIDRGLLRKVVLARSMRVRLDSLDLATIARALAERGHGGYTFAIDVGEGRTLIGTSPELLVSRHGERVLANPVAGSVPRCADPAEDLTRGRRLLRSAKDRDEHALVVEAVAEALRPLCDDLVVPSEPELIRTAEVWHLSTRITGRVRDASTSSLALAVALHPTPAVCGTPTDDALSTISELEPFDRGFYTGAVGWCDADGDGEWAVTLRCGVAEAGSVRLFAGAGIVTGSRPEAELAETTAKFGTLLHALGVDLREASDVAR